MIPIRTVRIRICAVALLSFGAGIGIGHSPSPWSLLPLALWALWCLGDFGPVPGAASAFFVRGALSIDRNFRMEGVDWWRAEEIESGAMGDALAAYEAMRPKVVLSHDLPESLLPRVLCGDRGFRSATGALLDAMFRAHRPEVWYFGHHHRALLFREDGTYFRCLEACELLEADL